MNQAVWRERLVLYALLTSLTALSIDALLPALRLIEAVTLDKTRAHWIAKLGAAGIPSGPIQNVAQAMRDPQILARNMVVDVLDRNGRPAFKAAGNPIKMSAHADPATRGHVPDLDESREAILKELGFA